MSNDPKELPPLPEPAYSVVIKTGIADVGDYFTVGDMLAYAAAVLAARPPTPEVSREVMESCMAQAHEATFQGFACSVVADKIDRLHERVYDMGFECGWHTREKMPAAATPGAAAPAVPPMPEQQPVAMMMWDNGRPWVAPSGQSSSVIQRFTDLPSGTLLYAHPPVSPTESASRRPLEQERALPTTEFKPDWANYRQGRADGRAEATDDDAIKAMVNRFLMWPLPKTFSPDCGISFDGRKDDQRNKNKTWPVGTNLFTADEARAMFEHACATPARALPEEATREDAVRLDWIEANWGAWCGSEHSGLFHGRDWGKQEWISAPNLRTAIDVAIAAGSPRKGGE